MKPKCAFCDICNSVAEASVIFQDDTLIAFMSTHPVNNGEVILATKLHTKKIEDLSDKMISLLAIKAKDISNILMNVYRPICIGWVVHGFMVHHAHIILIPQHNEYDITSSKWAKIRDGKVVFDETDVLKAPREELDHQARIIKEYIEKRG